MWDPKVYNQRFFRWGLNLPRRDADGDGDAETLWKPFDTENFTFNDSKAHLDRKELEPLRRGASISSDDSRTGGADQGLFVFERATDTDSVIVGINLLKPRQYNRSKRRLSHGCQFRAWNRPERRHRRLLYGHSRKYRM